MLFWPWPSERLSLVDFMGLWHWGSVREEVLSTAAGWQRDMVWGRSRCGTIRSNPFQLPCSRMSGAWLGSECCLVTGPCWRDGGLQQWTIVWICQHEMSVKSHQSDVSMTAYRRADESGRGTEVVARQSEVRWGVREKNKLPNEDCH